MFPSRIPFLVFSNRNPHKKTDTLKRLNYSCLCTTINMLICYISLSLPDKEMKYSIDENLLQMSNYRLKIVQEQMWA